MCIIMCFISMVEGKPWAVVVVRLCVLLGLAWLLWRAALGRFGATLHRGSGGWSAHGHRPAVWPHAGPRLSFRGRGRLEDGYSEFWGLLVNIRVLRSRGRPRPRAIRAGGRDAASRVCGCRPGNGEGGGGWPLLCLVVAWSSPGKRQSRASSET